MNDYASAYVTQDEVHNENTGFSVTGIDGPKRYMKEHAAYPHSEKTLCGLENAQIMRHHFNSDGSFACKDCNQLVSARR